MRRYIQSVTVLLLVLFGIGCDKKIGPIDYTKTTWQEIKGYKSKGYGVSANIEYTTKMEVCREKRYYWSMADGSSGSYFISKSKDLSFDADLSKNRLSYVIRFPLNFKQGECEFWAHKIDLSVKENKSIKNNTKGENTTVKKAFNHQFLVMFSSKKNEINYNYPMNIYCQRIVFFTNVLEKSAYCRPTGVIGSAQSILVDFSKEEYQPFKLNILLSDDIKCHKACTDKEMLKAGTKEKMYWGHDDEPATTDIRNEKFVPSEILFTEFKKKNNIK